jgi:branched-chain amino acid transport system permease protein
MDATIVLFLLQDAIVNGAIYALVAIALVLVFAVTRVILIPQGEFVAFATLTLASLQAGQRPAMAWLLIALGGLNTIVALVRARRRLDVRTVGNILIWNLVVPVVIAGIGIAGAALHLGLAANIAITLALIVPLGVILYDLAFDTIAEASVLTLLIVAFGVHIALNGLGLAFFGPEGANTPPLLASNFSLGDLLISGQSLCVIGVTLVLMGALGWFFRETLIGKALRACSVNRLGAQLVGMPTVVAGRLAFGVAAFIGAVSGILIGAVTTIYYDSGFLIGLKGFVAAIVAGLASYPFTVLAALLVGVVESFSSFWASAYKEVLVFTIIIPFLLWRSIQSAQTEEEE